VTSILKEAGGVGSIKLRALGFRVRSTLDTRDPISQAPSPTAGHQYSKMQLSTFLAMGLALLPELAAAGGGFYNSCKHNVGPLSLPGLNNLARTTNNFPLSGTWTGNT
jgi:hypothetical protein